MLQPYSYGRLQLHQHHSLPCLEMSSAVHGLRGEVSTGEPEGDHDRIQGWGGILDATMYPPVLGVGLLNHVMTRLVGFNRNDLQRSFTLKHFLPLTTLPRNNVMHDLWA